jgi:hypothetical protein
LISLKGRDSYVDDFLSDVSLITLNTLPSGARFNQEYFVNNILPDFLKEIRRELTALLGSTAYLLTQIKE